MNMNMLATAVPLLFSSVLAMAQETPEPLTLQTQDQTRLQQQQHLQSMTADERALYREMNTSRIHRQGASGEVEHPYRSGEGNGKMKRLRDGSGADDALRSEHRSEFTQRMEQRNGYGSGFGSRMGGAHGRR